MNKVKQTYLDFIRLGLLSILILSPIFVINPALAMGNTSLENMPSVSNSAISSQAQAKVRAELSFLIPLFIRPLGNKNVEAWKSVVTAHNRVPSIAIINPCNGPIMKYECDTSVNDGDPKNERPTPDYVWGLNMLRDAEIPIFAYVYTNWANQKNKSYSSIINDINLYHKYFQVDGFFLDEVEPNEPDYYKKISQHIKFLSPNYQIILNPGSNTLPNFLNQQIGDLVVTFEEDSNKWWGDEESNKVKNYPSNDFAFMTYKVENANVMRKQIDIAISRGLSHVYLTNDGWDDNPWDSFPSFWQEQVNYVEWRNNPTCMGRPVTKIGTEGPDEIYGTEGPDVIHGLGGDDTIYGLDGNDIICGGKGHDTINGNQGNDQIYGNLGNDTLRGGKDNDIINGNQGNDQIYGNLGDDTLRGGKDNDIINGNQGNDEIYGNLGYDTCTNWLYSDSCEQ